MGVVQRFEQRLGGLVEGAFAKVFKGEVQPVELAGALKKETDLRREVVDASRIITVNAFTISLGDRDFARIDEWSAPLARELATMIREHAADEHYSFVGPISIDFVHDPAVSTGRFHIASTIDSSTQRDGNRQTAIPDQRELFGLPARAAVSGRPRLQGPMIGEQPITKPLTTIGRAPGADIRIDDSSVSRQHAQLQVSGEEIAIVDAGSTNGIKVNGTPVGSAQLRDGDQLTLGSVTLVFRRDQA